MKTHNTRHLTTAGMLLAIGILLPFVTAHMFALPGNVLLPMHLPVFLLGILCGPLYGGIGGILVPILSCLFTGMPALFPMLPIMMGELFTYGLLSGILTRKWHPEQKLWRIFPILLVAMTGGRCVYGLLFHALTLVAGELTAPTVGMAIVTGIPGLIIQFLLIPSVYAAQLKTEKRHCRDALSSARTLLEENRVTSVVIQNNQIIKTEYARGIAPMIALYDSGLLDGSVVADKIIGKAAAMILSLGGVREVYGEVMSKSAEEWFREHRIPCSYATLTDQIENRTQTGMCPMEQTVKNLTDEAEALTALRKKLSELTLKKEDDTL